MNIEEKLEKYLKGYLTDEERIEEFSGAAAAAAAAAQSSRKGSPDKSKRREQDDTTKAIIKNLSGSKLFGRDLNKDRVYYNKRSHGYIARADNKREADALAKEMSNQGLRDIKKKKTEQGYRVTGQ